MRRLLSTNETVHRIIRKKIYDIMIKVAQINSSLEHSYFEFNSKIRHLIDVTHQ